MKRAGSVALGLVLLAVAVGFCVATFQRERDRVEDALAGASQARLALALAVAAGAMTTLALGWRRCLALVGSEHPRRPVAAWYFVGELGKYVPGAIWPVVGRAELAHRGGVGRPAAYGSVTLSLAAWYGAAVLPLAVPASHPAVQRTGNRVLARLTGGRVALEVLPWRDLLVLLLRYVATWALVGAVTAVVVSAYGGTPGWRAPVIAVVAWVCGFLVVPVPAGAGVREAVFVAASGLPDGLALTVAVTVRLAFVAVDLAGAGVAPLVAGLPPRVLRRGAAR